MDNSTQPIRWTFPLPRPHAGVPLGNGTQGLMIWGDRPAEGERWKLNITVGRAGFWDHRGGVPFAAGATYKKVRAWLEAGDLESIQEAFAAGRDVPFGPQQLGGGRVVLTLPEGWWLTRALLHPNLGTLEVGLGSQERGESLFIGQSIGDEATQDLAWVSVGAAVREGLRVDVVPSYDLCPEAWKERGISPSTAIGDGVLGFVQSLPDDPPLALAVEVREEMLVIATALGRGGGEAGDDVGDEAGVGVGERARVLAGSHDAAAIQRVWKAAQAWWQNYWETLPELDLPDPILQRAYALGMVKFAGCTAPLGVPSGLQGPFLEDYQLPPWAADYHFNINEQMIYWPALLTGRFEHLDPMWRMIRSWWARLEANARAFFELDEDRHAVMLPHAVDDRCHVVGSFWTGAFDHGCTAWVALMAHLHWRYSGDEAVRDDVAVPLLRGAFEGYWAMMEVVGGTEPGSVSERSSERRSVSERSSSGRLSLPVSVSPEWRGARIDAWGRDASFQLAACHAVVDALVELAQDGVVEMDERWGHVRRGLPRYTTIEGPLRLEHPETRRTRIALWEGMDLVESHRHHSHLASIYPFATIDPFDERHRDVVRASLQQWVLQGSGAWSGWCLPWAATLHARCGNADGAVAWLHVWQDVFTNVGGGTLHDGDFPGVTTLAPPMLARDASRDSGQVTGVPKRGGEVMQMDAAMGGVTAILELFVQCRRQWIDGKKRTVIQVMPSIPRGWRETSFEGIHAEGGFILGGEVQGGRLARVTVKSTRGGTLRIVTHGGYHEVQTQAGETLSF